VLELLKPFAVHRSARRLEALEIAANLSGLSDGLLRRFGSRLGDECSYENLEQ
jgi:hypothetical protein